MKYMILVYALQRDYWAFGVCGLGLEP